MSFIDDFNDNNFWYWLGGFFDGEGCLHIAIGKCKTSLSGYKIRPTIAISQSVESIDIIESIKKRVGYGNISLKLPKKDTHTSVSNWTANSNDAILFANTIYPYLLVKKNTCKRFLDICALIKEHKHYTKEGFIEIIKQRELLNLHKRNKYTKKVDFYEKNMSKFEDIIKTHRRWTDDEKEIIIKNIDSSIEDLCILLKNRPYGSVYWMKYEMRRKIKNNETEILCI